ncbi:MAG: hypothetical protein H0T68_11145 [Gemmatimonadales bacterium]|nr:hypothetical protein [Gemmatimonadales bacterium]
MIGTFAYLIGRSARNRLARQLRRLRQPRYSVALVLGILYIWFIIVYQRPGSLAPEIREAGWLAPAGAVVVAGLVAWAWIFAAERRVLAFTPAEVTFLFPAPISRRQLIHFKLLRRQLVILVNTLVWTLLLSPRRFDASAWLRAGGLWVLFTTLSLHRLAASYVRGSLSAHGVAAARRRKVSLVAVALALLGAIWVAAEASAILAAGWNGGIGPFLAAIGTALDLPATRLLLAPFLALMGPLTAGSAEGWLRAMGPALAILALHYVWVVRSDAAFEEAAAEASLRRAEALVDRSRKRRSPRAVSREPPPYRLAPDGSPAGAILWKNLVAVVRTGRPRSIGTTLVAGGIILAVLSFRSEGKVAEVVGWLAAMVGGFLFVIGPQWVRSDLRGDLSKLDLLRSYPIPARSLVTAEVASSTLVLSALQLGVLGFAYLAFLGNRAMEPSLVIRSAVLAAAFVFLPAVNLLGLLIHNGAAMLYPAWIAPGSDRPGGVEALGQNMLAMIAYLALLATTLLLPVAVGAAVFLGFGWGIGWWAAVPASAAALGVAAAEARVMIGWIGRVFERSDPASAGTGR